MIVIIVSQICLKPHDFRQIVTHNEVILQYKTWPNAILHLIDRLLNFTYLQTVINCINVKILIMIIQRFHTILIFKSKVRMKLRCCSESLSHKKHVDRQLVRRDEQSGQSVPTVLTLMYYYPSFSHIAKKNPLFSGVVNVSRSLWERLLII